MARPGLDLARKLDQAEKALGEPRSGTFEETCFAMRLIADCAASRTRASDRRVPPNGRSHRSGALGGSLPHHRPRVHRPGRPALGSAAGGGDLRPDGGVDTIETRRGRAARRIGSRTRLRGVDVRVLPALRLRSRPSGPIRARRARIGRFGWPSAFAPGPCSTRSMGGAAAAIAVDPMPPPARRGAPADRGREKRLMRPLSPAGDREAVLAEIDQLEIEEAGAAR